ncbi:DUF4097 domain-containing protein [Pseudoxanthomonas sp. UTMC 1351]|uniref:DUF4097 domain-containing protein n=1 Tax=Pseudoxanthomonas sp. UTMC 1351 TaxID=2695853 RepID=UPI0034CDB844
MSHIFFRSLSLPLLLLAAAAFAQTPIDETRPLDARGRIDIGNVKGRIEVRAWDRDEVKISGTLGEGVEKLVIEGNRQHLVVEVRYPKGGWGNRDKSGPTEMLLNVPRRADLKIESVSANVHVTGVASSVLSINAVSGDVMVAAAPAKASIDAVSGDLALTLNSGDVDVQSVSGDMVLRGRLNGDIDAETVSGNIEIDVVGERIRELKANTVSGDVNVRTALAPKGEIKLESVSGDLLLRLPKDVSAQARGESFSGDLKATGVTVEKRQGPGSSFSTRYGDGSGDIGLQAFSGSAEIRLE